VYDPRMMKHENEGYPHPEQPARISKIYDVLVEQGLVARCVSWQCVALSRRRRLDAPLPRVAGARRWRRVRPP
jgi:hypothetical protein